LGEIMRAFHLFHFVSCQELLRDHEEALRHLCIDGEGGRVLVDSVRDNITLIAKDLRARLGEAEFEAAIKRLDGPFARDVVPNISVREMHVQLKVLREAIDGDLNDRWFAVVSKAKGSLVFTDHSNDWELVEQRFISAKDDVEEAQFCYALERNTATVFHCMRVAEIGLRSLARRMGVKLPKRGRLEWAEWQTVLREMDKIADAIAITKKAGPAKDAIMEFYRGALGQFYGFKDEYRNHVMHTRGSYDEHRAASVLLQVRDFMTKLAKHIDEKGRIIHEQ
jgi:hypothetical protein